VNVSKLPSRIERVLFDRLSELTVADLQGELGDQLSRPEIKSLIARRDDIVRHYSDLIIERGEAIVLLEETEPTSSFAGRVATAAGRFLPGITFGSGDEIIVR
jgi:tetrahydromethanopterin S-methyltransferase subunit H